jgi:hypothetical protein
MRKLAVAIVVVAVATIGIPSIAPAAPPASTPNTTYRIHGAAVTTPVIAGTCPDELPPGPPPVVPITVTVTGTGVVSRLGAVTVRADETGLGICLGGPVPAPVQVLTVLTTYTAANGDVLRTETTSSSAIEPIPGTPYLGFTAVDRITGGSGRMDGASGRIDTSVTFDPTTSPIQASFTIAGSVTLPKG